MTLHNDQKLSNQTDLTPVLADLFCYIFRASNDKKSQREISDIAGVAEVTIKQSYRLMRDRAAELFPENFEFTTTVEQLPAS